MMGRDEQLQKCGYSYFQLIDFFLLELGADVRKMDQVPIHGGNFDDSMQILLPGQLSFSN